MLPKEMIRRVFCIGRNYRLHARELNNALPEKPVVFLKPKESVFFEGTDIIHPGCGRDLQHESEWVVRIGKEGVFKQGESAGDWIDSMTLGLDLTLRDLQEVLKKKGLPWEKAKAFDRSAPLGDFVPFNPELSLNGITFTCHVNDRLRQTGNTGTMIFPIETCLAEISRYWRLLPGDIVFTGTPEGVGSLSPGDRITIASASIGVFTWNIV